MTRILRFLFRQQSAVRIYPIVAFILGSMLGGSVVAAQPSSTTALQSSPNPSIFGQTVTLTATVTPGTATGKITWYDGVTVLGIGVLKNGQASLKTSLLASGVRTLTAFYSGDQTYLKSSSAPLSQTVTALPATGFGPPSVTGIVNSPGPVAVGDFNGDGRADLAVLNTLDGAISILLGKGNGTFQPAVQYGVGTTPLSLAIGDFNGDGLADLAVANRDTSNISVLIGNGDGTFQPAINYPVGSLPASIAVADFNRDGKADLAVTNLGSNNLSILLGNGDGTFTLSATYPAGINPLLMAIGDFNKDGIADLAVPAADTGSVGIFIGNGDGTFQAPVFYSAGQTPESVAVGDFNRDGFADLAVVNFNSNSVSVLLGHGDGSFASAVNYGVGSGTNSVVIGDFNGDGISDIAVSNENDNNISVLIGIGDGTFRTAVNYGVGLAPTPLAVGEFNGDGRTDLVVPNYASDDLSIFLGAGLTPDLSIAKSHEGNFSQGQTGANYSITASNTGQGQTEGTVTVLDSLPSGLTATAIGGDGWDCSLATLTCFRSDVLAAGGQFPTIAVTVNVATNAPSTVTNTATVSGGSEINLANDVASDATIVMPASNAPPAGPSISDGGIVNAASFASVNGRGSAVAPGSLVSIFGTFPGATSATAGSVPYPLALGNVSVTFSGINAPLLSVVLSGTAGFVNAQVPFEVLGATATSAMVDVVVTINNASSQPQAIQVVSTAPGVFTVPPDGQHTAILVFVDPADNITKIAAPASAAAMFGYPTAPIPRGEEGFFYATGLGDLSPPVANGAGGANSLGGTSSAVAMPAVLIGGIPAMVPFAGQAPGFPGVNQINVVVPSNAPVGDAVPLQIQTPEGVVSTAAATIAVR